MVERYVAQILTVQPSGPYWLGGYSLGGTVAYAVAHSLRRAGHPVARVIILDTGAPGIFQHVDWQNWSDTQWLLEMAEDLESAFGKELQFTQHLCQDREWLTLPFDEQLRQLNHAFHQAHPEIWEVDETAMRGLFQVYRANLQAIGVYQPEKSIPVPITLVRCRTGASDTASGEPTDPTWGWFSYADGSVDLRWVEGEHESLMREPHIQEVAAQIAALLQGE
jgi:thioesterase domain-containing protein